MQPKKRKPSRKHHRKSSEPQEDSSTTCFEIDSKSAKNQPTHPLTPVNIQRIFQIKEITRHRDCVILWKATQYFVYFKGKCCNFKVNFDINYINHEEQIFNRIMEASEPSPPLEISYVLITRNFQEVYLGNSYGFLTRSSNGFTSKVHSNEINCIAKRGKMLLTCSLDCTALVISESTFKPMHMLKDQFHIKHPIYRGDFIDDSRVAVCSHSFVKIYSLGAAAFRIKSALVTVEIGYSEFINIINKNSFIFCNSQDRLRILNVSQSVPYYIDDHSLAGIKIKNVCTVDRNILLLDTQKQFVWYNLRTNSQVCSIQKHLVSPKLGKNRIEHMFWAVPDMLFFKLHASNQAEKGEGYCVKFPSCIYEILYDNGNILS